MPKQFSLILFTFQDDGAPPPPRYNAPPPTKNGPRYDAPNNTNVRNSPNKSFDSLEPTARTQGTVSASQVIPDNQLMVSSHDNTADNNDSEW